MRVLSNKKEITYESCYGSISKDGSFSVLDSTNASLEGEVICTKKELHRFGDIILEQIDSSTVRRWLIHEIKGDVGIF